jgi:parallel beta-helix repeat protein
MHNRALKFEIIFLLMLSLTIHVSLGHDVRSPDINQQSLMTFTRGNILYVSGIGSGNYSKIKYAIENASDGDTIFVYNGTYVENLNVDKPIFLIGENKSITIIDGGKNGSTINVNSENVIIKNFTITGGGFDTDIFANFFRAGIRVTGSNNIISNNIFKKNRLGISGVRVTNLTIKDNIFIEDGIMFSPYENDERVVIKLEYFLHNIKNNTVNGKPLYYFYNEKDKVINNWEIGQLILVNCTNFTIKNVSISKTDMGMIFAFCNKCLTEKCNFSKNILGIWTSKSDENVFRFNNISNNYHHGVVLDYYSKNNKIRYNNISNNYMAAVGLEWKSNNNLITKNNFLKNNWGSGFELRCFFNKWYKNYYTDWIGVRKPILFFLPKVILVWPLETCPIKIPIGLRIDFSPAKEPYDL